MKDVTLELIHKDLETIKRELMAIKEHMVDIDSIMTEGDQKVLQEYIIEKLKEDRHRTIRLKESWDCDV